MTGGSTYKYFKISKPNGDNIFISLYDIDQWCTL